MEETEDALLLPDDILREILLRLPADDPAALFRCAATCKRWRAVVTDPSFLRHHWPENACHPSSLLGFFDMPRVDNQEPPFFFPISPGLVFGARRRSLASFVSGAPDNILNNAVPLAARGGLLLVRLAPAAGDSLRLAVCDLLTRTCDVLPPLECKVSQCQCAILAHEDCCSLDGLQQGRTTPLPDYWTFFKVLAMVVGRKDQDCYLYTFSSSEPRWSEPRNCFDVVYRRHDTFIVRILMGTNSVTVCRGVAYWLGSYSTNLLNPPCYFTFGVDVKTGQTSITEISIPANELAAVRHSGIMLTVTVDGTLLLLHLQREGGQLNTWTRGDNGTWLRTRVVKLKPLHQPVWSPVYITWLSGEKSGRFFMTDVYGRVHKADPETGVMEDVITEMFQDSLSTMAVAVEIDWPAFFMSRLAV